MPEKIRMLRDHPLAGSVLVKYRGLSYYDPRIGHVKQGDYVSFKGKVEWHQMALAPHLWEPV